MIDICFIKFILFIIYIYAGNTSYFLLLYFILCPFDNWVNFVSKIIELVNERKL